MIVDAFTDRPFAGNPAAVCLLQGQPSDRWMGLVAAEVNLSETAFCWPEGDGWRLRWFTPRVEVPLCGHATLATAHVIWDQGLAPGTEAVRFETLSGRLTATRDRDRIELDLPASPLEELGPLRRQEVATALGLDVVYAALGGHQYLAEVNSAAAVRSATPDLRAVASLEQQGLIVTAPGDQPGVDYVLRYFAPNAGIAEDPVTGSAQCRAGPHWQRRLGRSELVARQLSSRGGTLFVRVGAGRVGVAGHAVTVARCELSQEASPAHGA